MHFCRLVVFSYPGQGVGHDLISAKNSYSYLGYFSKFIFGNCGNYIKFQLSTWFSWSSWSKA